MEQQLLYRHDEVIPAHNIENLRDLGGIATDGGVVKSGCFFRCGGLSLMDDSDCELLKALGVGYIFDFRSTGEANGQPDIVPEGIKYMRRAGIPLLEQPTHQQRPVKRPEQSDAEFAQDFLKSITSAEDSSKYMRVMYLNMAESSLAYRDFFREILEDRTGAMLFHCSAGKDRTGVGAALILRILGAGEQDIMQNYMMSNEVYKNPKIGLLGKLGADKLTEEQKLMANTMQMVKQEFMGAYNSHVLELYGSWHEFFSRCIELTAADIAELKRRYTE